MDLIQLLLNCDLTGICFDIFSHLDSKSFANCRLVNQQWKNFIDYYFFNLPKGRNWIKKTIAENVLDEKYQHKTDILEHEDKLFALVADEDSVCVTTYSGKVFNYELFSFKHLWTLKLCDDTIQHCMDKEKVYVVSSGFENIDECGNLYIIDRISGTLILTVEKLHSRGIAGICAFKGSVIATADTSGMIKFHQLLKKEEAQKDKNDSTILETNLIYEEKKYNGHRHGFTHLDYDDRNEKLISGSQDGELVAWDFNSFKQLHSVDSKLEVMSVRVSWPLVAACSSFVISHGHEPGVKLFDLEKEILISHVTRHFATDLILNEHLLMASGQFERAVFPYNSHVRYKNWSGQKFWNLKTILKSYCPSAKKCQKNQQQEKENEEILSCKTILTSPSSHQICAMVGSVIVTTEGNQIFKRKFFP